MTNNPYQEPLADELSLGEALRAIAERTSFRSEEEQSKVFAAIEKAIDGENEKKAEQERYDQEITDKAEQGTDHGRVDPVDPVAKKATPASKAK